MGKNCCLCKPKVIYQDRYIDRIIYSNKPENKKEKYDDLFDNLSGRTKDSESSDTSETSEWLDTNPNHFEIFILCGNKKTKLKVKKKYSISKVITKFLELEKVNEEIEGKLMREGCPLKPNNTLGELGISKNETLCLV